MRSDNLFRNAFILGVTLLSSTILAQQPGLVGESRPKSIEVAGADQLYCAGYVTVTPANTARREMTAVPNKIVGAYDEQDGWHYSQDRLLVINGGANKGVKAGDMFSVIRPRGEVESRWTRKDRLGFYVQELGTIEVVSVKPEVSWARVRTSCDTMMLGDLIVPFQRRSSPVYSVRPTLDLFRDPSGKATGRIFMARDLREALTSDTIVYVDLGAEDSVAPGDYLTIWRPLGKGNPFDNDEDESVSARQDGFQSFEYRGGKFSNQAGRKYGSQADRKVVTTEEAKKYRPSGLRKVVGEAVVLNVKERTASVLITRTSQEVHTGDYVEAQ
ncbi:MAG: hypothetical protein ACK4S4_15105 [Pyrinomonadaceae bacterium]